MSTRNPHLQPRTSLIAVGEFAPDFTLLDQDRKEWKLSDAIETGDVALCFVPLAFTGVCGTEMKCLSDDSATWTAKGAQFVGISCDSFAVQKAWADKEGYKHRMLADMHREVCKGYGLFWSDLNVAQRGTIVIGKSADGRGKVKFAQAREPGKAMTWPEILAMV